MKFYVLTLSWKNINRFYNILYDIIKDKIALCSTFQTSNIKGQYKILNLIK